MARGFPQKNENFTHWDLKYPRFEAYSSIPPAAAYRDTRFDIYDPNDNPNELVRIYRYLLDPRRWVSMKELQLKGFRPNNEFLEHVRKGRIEKRKLGRVRLYTEYRVTDLGLDAFITGIFRHNSVFVKYKP